MGVSVASGVGRQNLDLVLGAGMNDLVGGKRRRRVSSKKDGRETTQKSEKIQTTAGNLAP